MQTIIKATFLLALLQQVPVTLGDTACTQSNAAEYDAPSSGDGCSAADLARDDTGCVQDYCTNGGTPASLQTCFCLALNESNCGSTSVNRREVGTLKHKRADFTCSSSEQCYINPADGGLFCLDEATGDYVGESGDSGNVDTGAYTAAPSGESSTTKATITEGTEPTSAKPSSETKTATTTSSTASARTTSATATGARGSASVTSTTTRTAGMARVTAEAVLGILGLAVGLAL